MDMDFLLTQKMRMGDEKAVEAFVTKYYGQILRYCRLRIGDYGYAEDAAQETFERFSEISVSTVITAGWQITCM